MSKYINWYTVIIFNILFYLTIPNKSLKLADNILGILIICAVMIESVLSEAFNVLPFFFNRLEEVNRANTKKPVYAYSALDLFASLFDLKKYILSSTHSIAICRLVCVSGLLLGFLVNSSIIRTGVIYLLGA